MVGHERCGSRGTVALWTARVAATPCGARCRSALEGWAGLFFAKHRWLRPVNSEIPNEFWAEQVVNRRFAWPLRCRWALQPGFCIASGVGDGSNKAEQVRNRRTMVSGRAGR